MLLHWCLPHQQCRKFKLQHQCLSHHWCRKSRLLHRCLPSQWCRKYRLQHWCLSYHRCRNYYIGELLPIVEKYGWEFVRIACSSCIIDALVFIDNFYLGHSTQIIVASLLVMSMDALFNIRKNISFSNSILNLPL